MQTLFRLFNFKINKERMFRGQGYTEDGALHHANQRFQAWLKDRNSGSGHTQIVDKEISYVRKNALLVECYIKCTFKNLTL